MTSVPKRWPGETFVLLGCGPSLTREDVEFCQGKARVIAINDSYKLAAFADVVYACDRQWWRWHQGVPSFTGLKYGLTVKRGEFPGVEVLQNTGDEGLELAPTGLRTGKNSGYQAINLAVHLGAVRILLLGYDMRVPKGQPTHWFGEHPLFRRPPFVVFLEKFPTIVKPLQQAGVTVINCTPQSALTCFPMASLRDTLASIEVAA